MNTHKFFNLVMAFIFAFSLLGVPAPALAQEPQLNPFIHVGPNQGFVYAQDWPTGTIVHMIVARSGSTVYTSDATVGPCLGSPGSGPCGPNDAYFDLGYYDSGITRFDLQPGDVITITGGDIIRSMVVSALQVTDVNASTDTLTGIADIGRDVDVGTCNGPNMVVTPDSSGHWIANFAPFDIFPGLCGGATQKDENNNVTQQGWVLDNPNFNVRANNDQVEARARNDQVYFSQWRVGDTLTLTIDNPNTTTANPDYTITQTAGLDPQNSGQIYASFNLTGIYDIQIGDLVNVSNGPITKTTVVMNLAFTDVNLETDTVTGIAEPNQLVNIWTCNGPCVNRDETANEFGIWSTNFAVPGEQDWEQETADLRPGAWIDSSVWDGDGENTMFGWNVPNPTFTARLTDNEIHGYQWPLGALVTLTIDDPNNGGYIDTQTVTVADWDPNQSFVKFRLSDKGFSLQRGMTVVMSDEQTTKTYVVANLAVTDIDSNADTVSGTGDPGAQVDIGHMYCDQSGCYGFRRVVADAGGNWIADFAHVGEDSDEQDIFDIRAGTGSEARQCDNEGECTQVGWYVSDPRMQVSYEHDWIQIQDFTAGGEVTYTIYDHQGGHALFGPVTGPVDSHGNGWISSNLHHTDLIPGNYITAVNEATGEEVSILIRNVNLDYIGADDDIVFGTAEPNSTLDLQIGETHDSGFNLTVPVDGAGYWEVDLVAAGHPIDGYNYANADLYDAEGDTIIAQSPWINAQMSTDNFGTTNFSKNADVTLTLYDSLGGAVLYGPVTLRTEGSGGVWVNLWGTGIDLVPGNYITAYDHTLNFTKSLVVEPFTFDEINAADDYVRGTSSVGEWASLHVESLFSNWGQDALTDENGQWFRDYGLDNYDITEQMWASGWAVDYQGNRSEDHTTGLPGIEASLADDWISGFNFSPNRQVRVRIYESQGGSLLADVSAIAGGSTQLNVDYWQHGVDLQPGMYILAEDLETGKYSELTLVYLTFDAVDYDADTAWGKAEPFARVVVRANHLFDNIEFTVDTDEFGNWLADFSYYGADINSEWNLRAMIFDSEFDTTVANAPRPPQITASLDGNWVNGNNWTPSNTVSINIYEYEGGPSVGGIFTWGTDNYGNFNANLWNEGVDLLPGNYITVTDNFSGIVKVLTLPNLTIDYLDPVNDVAGGLAPADTRLSINFNNQQEGIQFDLFSESNGTWEADFGAHDFDLQPGSSGNVRISDADGDTIQVDGHVIDPTFSVVPDDPNSGPVNMILGWDWEVGTTVNLCIDNPPYDTVCDYTDALTVPSEPSGFAGYQFQFNIDPSIFQIMGGQRVQLDNGLHTEQHIVTNMRLLWVDWDTDTVGGTADPGSQIVVPAAGDQYVIRRVTANSEGNWIADFAHPGIQSDEQNTLDLRLGHHFFIPEQWDENGNSTKFWWQPANHYIEASPNSNWIHAREWRIGTLITMNISGSSETYTATMAQASWNPGDPNDIVADFDLQGYDIQAGDVITASGNGTTKTLTISQLAITDFDIDADTISGIGTPGVEIQICANIDNRCISRWVTVDGSGEWTANYHNPGSGNDDPDTFDVLPGSNGWAAEYEEDSDRTWYDWQVVWPPMCAAGDSVSGTVTFGDGITPIQAATVIFENYFNGSQLLQTSTNANGNYSCYLPAGDYRIWAYGGNQSREYFEEAIHENAAQVVVFEGSQQSGVDFTLDTPTYSPQNLYFNMDAASIVSELAVRQAIAYGTDRQHIANATYIETEVLNSIMPSYYWAYPDSGLPIYNYDPVHAQQILENAGWVDEDSDGIREKDGIRLHLEYYTSSRNNINNIRTRLYPIFVANMAAIGIEVDVHDMENLNFINETPRIWDLAQFAWSGIDLNVDYGPDNGQWFYYTGNAQNVGGYSNPAADALLNSADAVTTREGKLTYLQNHQIMVMTDLPVLPLVLANDRPLNYPNFGARLTENEVHAYNWPLGAELTITIDGVEADFNATVIVEVDSSWDPNQTFAKFELGEFTLEAGQIVTLTDGFFARSTVVTSLTVTSVNPDEDTISGTAEPGTQVDVGHIYCDQTGCYGFRRVFADVNGNWIADFSEPGEDGDEQDLIDIVPGMGNEARQSDDDGDTTNVQWSLRNPFLIAFPVNDAVESWEWPDATLVHLTIDDPMTAQSPDFEQDRVMAVTTWGDPRTYTRFDFAEVYDLKVGDIVTVTDGLTPRTHIVQNLSVTVADAATDTITGEANPGAVVVLWPHGFDQIATVQATTGANGVWQVDFTGLFDLVGGTDGRSHILDEAGNSTAVDWHVSNPNFSVRANYDQVEAYEWAIGDILTLSIDNPATDVNPDYTALPIVVGLASWDPSQTYAFFDLSGAYDVQIGDVVSVGNGSIMKTTIVTNLAFTDVHLDTEMVEGIAEPNQIVNVWACSQYTCVNRDETADQYGLWTTNFAVPGEQDWEQDTFDIQPGSWIDSSVGDEDGDSTMFGWSMNYSLHANFKDNEVHGHDWPGSSMVTLTIDNDTDPTNGVLYTDTKQADEDTSCGQPCFNLQGLFTLERGQVVTMSDSDVTKTVRISTLEVTFIDIDYDTISGVADPGSTISVDIHDIPDQIGRRVVVDANGQWVADFSTLANQDGQGIYDLNLGSSGRALQLNPDDTDDGTLEYWSISFNEPPVADAGPDQIALEADTVILDASASFDPEAGSLNYEWDLDNDGLYDDAAGVTTEVSFPDDGEYIVGLQVTDEGGLSAADTITITVNNVAPQITYIYAPATPLKLGTIANVSATFDDPGTADTFTATWNWDDGTTSSGIVNDHSVAGSHTYTIPGVYTLRITVTDDDGGSASTTYQYIVVYDPTGGFVTGGGWFIDPATGEKAHFGFTPKYQKDSIIPKGETEFKLGDLKFKSTSHEWLIINAAKAQFKGTGTINGVAGYEFLITVLDGSPDKIRVKIWSTETGAVIYNSQPGASDLADPVTVIGGGSIVIHKSN